METSKIIIIRADKKPRVTVTATGTESAEILITASDLQEAMALVEQGEAQALDAVKEWTPQEEPAPQPERPAEDPNRAEAERIVARAQAFMKNRTHRLTVPEVLYCAGLPDKWQRCTAAFDLGYMRGFNTARKSATR